MGRVRVGTASWTDKTLLESGWYPEGVDTPEKRLVYYAEQFPVVEVDSTYYTPPNERNSELWVARTPPDFVFNVKAFSLLTQHPTRPGALYKDLRPEGASKNLYPRDLPEATIDQVWERFLSALTPLHEAGKLGALLFQFPQWFPIGRRNKEYILQCQERAAPMRICVEFRNKTWMSEDNQVETLDFLRSYQVPYVCVDMPQGHPSSIPPVVAATADLAVVRFHGHSDKWTSKDIYDRFGYHYSEAELAEWAPKIAGLGEQAGETHVLLNNCHRNYAQVNARQLADLLLAGMD
ncbi:MAG: DUF72 domain-containing protein [Geodermatophilaceae bacterium]|nr:DUF72 domain-containing protein [Geodermatophilaceae bacterium]MDQ3455069.1 DUF72 domain-containing protein [Actinomycetota bacterium]